MRNRKPAAGRPISVKKWAATKFGPCDRRKYPIVSERKFMEGMERVGKIAYAAHIAAYFTKPQIVQMMLGLEQGEAPKLFEDLEEARKVFSELCCTIQAVQLRLLIGGAVLEVSDVQN